MFTKGLSFILSLGVLLLIGCSSMEVAFDRQERGVEKNDALKEEGVREAETISEREVVRQAELKSEEEIHQDTEKSIEAASQQVGDVRERFDKVSKTIQGYMESRIAEALLKGPLARLNEAKHALRSRDYKVAEMKIDEAVALLMNINDVVPVGMVFITGGCFEMGNTFDDGDMDERPLHEVCVDDFYMDKTEVTQAKWEEMMGNNPSRFKDCSDCPVERVSWEEVQVFIERLNKKTGRRYRLPTEAEWEYAARNGGKREKWAGTNNELEVGEYAWHVGNSAGKTHPVALKRPNGLGLYDMSGNVWEWMSDGYDSNYYKDSPKDNPEGSSSSGRRVVRGGSWSTRSGGIRLANRNRFDPDTRIDSIGFRLSLSLSGHNLQPDR